MSADAVCPYCPGTAAGGHDPDCPAFTAVPRADRLPEIGAEIAVFHSRYWFGPYTILSITARGSLVVRHPAWAEDRTMCFHDASYGDKAGQWKYACEVEITASAAGASS